MTDSKMTIIVVSYDGYSDMWEHFFYLKRTNWPDCPFNTILANNTKSFNDSTVRVVNCGDHALWSTRTKIALEQIETEYVCFLLEDYYISEKVDTVSILNVLDIMSKHRIDYYKLLSFSKISTPFFDKKQRIRYIPASLKYGISLQPSIWNRKFFLQMIGNGDYNPWRFELDRICDSEVERNPQKIVGLYDERNLLNICHMAVQGKYIPASLREMKRKGFLIDTSLRETMNLKESIFYSIKRHTKGLVALFPFLRKVGKFLGIESIRERETIKE